MGLSPPCLEGELRCVACHQSRHWANDAKGDAVHLLGFHCFNGLAWYIASEVQLIAILIFYICICRKEMILNCLLCRTTGKEELARVLGAGEYFYYITLLEWLQGRNCHTLGNRLLFHNFHFLGNSYYCYPICALHSKLGVAPNLPKPRGGIGWLSSPHLNKFQNQKKIKNKIFKILYPH